MYKVELIKEGGFDKKGPGLEEAAEIYARLGEFFEKMSQVIGSQYESLGQLVDDLQELPENQAIDRPEIKRCKYMELIVAQTQPERYSIRLARVTSNHPCLST